LALCRKFGHNAKNSRKTLLRTRKFGHKTVISREERTA
jgi:hypothetical protein